MAIRTILRETSLTIGRSRLLFILSLCITTISFFVLSLFVFLTANLFTLIAYFHNRIEILVFLEEHCRSEDVIPYVQNISGVLAVDYISPEHALEELKRDLGPDQARVLDAFEKSPIPPSLRVRIDRRYKNSSSLAEMSRKIGLIDGVEETIYGGEVIDRMSNFSRTFVLFDFILLIIIIFSVIFAIAQTIKMTVLVREQDIEVMQLVGASNQFIRLPFILEGVSQGILGGVLSFFLILGVYALFTIWTPSLIFFPQIFMIGHIFLGGLFGLIGSITAINRFVP